jgi:FtsH-binding integral membrane protein
MYDPNNPQQYPAQPYNAEVAAPGASLLDRVLGWLALSLFITAAGVFISMTTGFALPWFVALIGLIAMIFAIQWAVRSKNQGLAIGLFSLFALVEGLFLAPVITIYLGVNPAAVANAVLGTGGIFVFAAAVVWVTNRSFAAWGKWLLFALLAGIVLMVLAIFIPAFGAMQLLIDIFLGIVFVGLTIFDFWRVKSARPGDDSAILIALSLYLDFINIFLILLRIFGGRRD